jgi:hypothetical protein
LGTKGLSNSKLNFNGKPWELKISSWIKLWGNKFAQYVEDTFEASSTLTGGNWSRKSILNNFKQIVLPRTIPTSTDLTIESEEMKFKTLNTYFHNRSSTPEQTSITWNVKRTGQSLALLTEKHLKWHPQSLLIN